MLSLSGPGFSRKIKKPQGACACGREEKCLPGEAQIRPEAHVATASARNAPRPPLTSAVVAVMSLAERIVCLLSER